MDVADSVWLRSQPIYTEDESETNLKKNESLENLKSK